jgi:hypothetical protein
MSAQNTLAANEASTLLTTLANIKTQDLSYKIKPTYPLLATKIYTLQPTQTVTGAPASKEAIWNLNKAWLCNNMRIQTATTRTGSTSFSNPADKYYGLTMYETITIRTNGVTLLTLSDSYIRARVDDLPDNAKSHVMRYAMALVPTTEVVAGVDITSTVTYTPIFSSWFETVNANLNLAFLEQIQLVARFNTTVNSGSNEAYLTATPALQVFNWTPNQTYMAGLRAMNQPQGGVANMLVYDSMKEVFTLDSDTTTVARLRCNYPVTNMYFALVSKAAAADLGIASTLSPIDTVNLTLGGDSIFGSAVNASLLDYIKEMGGGSSLVTSSNTAVSRATQTVGTGTYSGWKKISFCLDPYDRTYCSGAMAMSGINNPILTLTYPDCGTASDFELQVVYEYWKIISISAQGVVQIAESY